MVFVSYPISKRRKSISPKKPPKKRKRSSQSEYTKATQQTHNKGPIGPKKQSLKRLIKTYFPGARVTEESLFKYSEFSYKLIHVLAERAISLTQASGRHTLLFDHVLQSLRMLGLEKAGDFKFKVNELQACEIHKTPAKQIQSKINSEFRKEKILLILIL